MQTVGVHEAKTHLSRLVDEVANGGTIEIARHGVPVARLVPVGRHSSESVDQAVAQIKALPRRRLKGVTVGELVQAGRR